MALKYLKDTEVNIDNVLIMTGDFNIRDYSRDPDFHNHSSHKDTLIDITDSLYLELSEPTNYVPTRYSNNQHKSNSVIDLTFLRQDSLEYDNHFIHPDWYLTSDHILLTINIAIFEEDIQTKKHIIIKNSKEEDKFIIELIEAIKELNMDSAQSKEALEHIIQMFTNYTKKIWYKYSKIVNITKHSKVWWDENCHRDLEKYRQTKKMKTGNNSRVQSRRQNAIFLI